MVCKLLQHRVCSPRVRILRTGSSVPDSGSFLSKLSDVLRSTMKRSRPRDKVNTGVFNSFVGSLLQRHTQGRT